MPRINRIKAWFFYISNAAGSPIQYLDAPEFQSYWDANAKQMQEAVKKIGKGGLNRAARFRISWNKEQVLLIMSY